MTAESEAPVIPTTLPGIAALILYRSANLHQVSRAAEGFSQEPAELADHIRELGKGIGYTKTATDYVFEKV